MLDFFSEWVIWYFWSKFEFEVKFKIKISFFRVLVFLMPKIDILEWSKSVLNHFESVRVHPNSLSLSLVRCSPTKSEIIPEIWSGSFSPKTSCSGKHRWRWILGRLKSANYRPEFALLNHISKPISKYLSNHSNWKQLKSA